MDSSERIPGRRGGDKKQGWSNSTQQVQALFTAPSSQRGISETWSASQLAPISSVRQHWNLEVLVSTGRSQQRSHNLISDPEHAPVLTAPVSSCMPKAKHGVSPAKIHEFLVFALESTRLLYIYCSRYSSNKRREEKINLQSPKQNKKTPQKPSSQNSYFKVRKERINYNPQVPVMVSGRKLALLCCAMPYFEIFV